MQTQNTVNQKFTIPVCFCCGKDYVEHLIVALTSVLETNQKNAFIFYIFSGNLGQEERALLEQIQQRYNNSSFVFHQIPVEFFNRFKITDQTRQDLSLATYYRYMAAELIPEQDKLLYLDCDLVVNGDLAPLYKTDLTDFLFAGVPEICLYENNYVYNSLGFSKEELYINAGVLLMNLKKMRQTRFFQHFIEEGTPLLAHIKYCDQDIMNILARGKIKEVDCIYNMTPGYILNCPVKKYQAVVVHYTGRFKPWTLGNMDCEMTHLYLDYLGKSILSNQIKVKNFCVYHKPGYPFENDLITPIQTGTYGLHTGMDMLLASSGDTIDYKNKNYGEMTAWYWVYKNYLPKHPELEYVGFCHYRRMLDYEKAPAKEDPFLKNTTVFQFVNEHNDSYSARKVYSLIKDYDVILPKKHILTDAASNEEQYLQWHPKKDLECLKEIIREDYPEYVPEMDEFFTANAGYYCLLFTMKKEHFVSFMEFALGLLSKLEKRCNWRQYNTYYTVRMPAFLMERFFNVWLMHNQHKYGWKILERTAYLMEEPTINFKSYSIPSLYFQYNRVRFLSKITWGKKRQVYIAKKRKFKKYLKKLKELARKGPLVE